MNKQNRRSDSTPEKSNDNTRIFSIGDDATSSQTIKRASNNDVDLNDGDLQILQRRRPSSSAARTAATNASKAQNGNQRARVTVQSNHIPAPTRVAKRTEDTAPAVRASAQRNMIPAGQREPRVTVHQNNPSQNAPRPQKDAEQRQPRAVTPAVKPTRTPAPGNTAMVKKVPDPANAQTNVIRTVRQAEPQNKNIETQQFTLPSQRKQPNSASASQRDAVRTPAYGVDDRTRSIPRVKSESTSNRPMNKPMNKPLRERLPKARKDVRASQPEEYEYSESAKANSPFSGVLKAVIYLTFVLLTSAILSYLGITVCNDVFAFVKPDTEQTVVIPENATVEEISNILKDADVIRYPLFFRLYAEVRHDKGIFNAGEYTISSNIGYDDLLATFRPAVVKRSEVQITIPEGYTVNQIIDLFVESGIGTREGFIDVIQNYDYDFWFVKELDNTEHIGRVYRLEGYLFPDTYRFYSDSDEATVIYKMLSRFNELYTEQFRARATELGYTTDQIITLASMVQMEAKYSSEYGAISSVFHNRLNHPNAETHGRLESDATIQYVLAERHSELTQEDLDIDSPYNTYVIKGLPVGPISNPCYAAITYALSPSETDYYYFVAQKNGYSLFAKTYAEHTQNKLIALG